jgi:ketosteroid isomerase-like protein
MFDKLSRVGYQDALGGYMRGKILLIAVMALLLGVASRPVFSQASKVEQEIRTLEQKMNDAYGRNDLPSYFSYYAPDFVQWLPEGRTDLAKYEKDWTDYIKAGNQVQRVELRDVVVKIGPSQDTAVVAYILYVKTKLADGKITEEENQETDIWFKRQGEWKVAALHYSPVQKK